MKKLNIAILIILLVFQTILGPIGSYNTAFAEEPESSVPASAETDTENSGAIEETVTEGPEAEEDSLDDTTGEEPGAEEEESKENPEEDQTGETSTGDETSDENEPGNIKDEEISEDKSAEGSTPTTIDNVVDRGDTNFHEEISLQINETEVASSVSAPLGSEVKFRVNLKLDAGHNYGAGSTLSYELPSQFAQLTVNSQELYMGSMIIGTVSISGQTATVTFSENIRGEAGGLPTEAWFEVSGKLQSTSGNWQETIQVPGFADITLNYTPAPNGTTITKSGVADRNGDNSEYITWTVDVNTNLTVNTAGGTTKFSDTLTGAHEFDSIVSITELNIAPNGTVTEGSPVTSLPTISGKAMEIDLPNKEYTGYRIVYKTKIGDPGNVANANFGNEAKYNEISSGKKNVPVSFGTPLEKTVSGPNSDLTADWTIKYNHNKRTILRGNAKLTDTWTKGHELEGNVIVYDEAGAVAIASNLYTVTLNDTIGFTLTFNDDVTEAYTIKYKTKPSGIYPTNGFTNENTVTREDMTTGGSSTKTVSYSKERFVLDKTAEGVNYADKTMDWKIKANSAGYNLASGTTFTDTYNGSLLKVQGTPKVTVGGQPFTDFTFTTTTEADGKETGFKLVFNEAVNKEIIITYTTEYEIKDIGTNVRTYINTVDLTDTGVFEKKATHTASQTIKGEQNANGKKEGYYNYQTKTFHWDVEVNFNYNSFTNAIFKDTLPESQKVKSIKVTEGTLNAGGSFVPGTEKTTSNTSGKDNEIVLELGAISGPYKITYESIDANAVFPHGSAVSISNKAALYEGTSEIANASWGKTVEVEHTEKILDKEGKQDGNSPKVNWNFKFNYAQSELKNIVITDTVGKIEKDEDEDEYPSQLILKDSFKVWEMNFTGTNPTPAKGNPVILTNENLIVDIEKGTFTLKLPDGDKAYYVEYSTVFMGPSGSKLENLVEVSYLSKDGSEGSDQYSRTDFTYGGGGNVSAMKLVIFKTDASTGQPMPNVKFDLFGPYTGSTLLASKTTNADGYLDYGLKLASSTQGKKYKVVEETLEGYEKLTHEFELDPAKVETAGKYAGYQVIQLSNIPKNLACNKFTVTLYDVDGKPYAAGNKVKFKNKSTEKSVEYTVGTNGKLVFKHSEGISGNEPVLAAGKYDVTYGGITKEIVVNYGTSPCSTDIKPSPSCPLFTVTLNEKDADGNDKPRVGVTVTLKDSTGNRLTTATPLTTDANGQFTVPSTTPAGTYTVYEGSKYLGEITVSYIEDNCETSLTQAPKCPIFTITLKDVNGNPRDGVTVVVKDASGNPVQPGTTFTTNENGQVILDNLPVGSYKLYEINSENNEIVLKEFTVNNECAVEYQPNPACVNYVIEVLDENGNKLSDGTVATVNGTGYSKQAAVENGKVTIPSVEIPAGDYTITYGTKTTEQFTVSYDNEDCENAIKIVKTPIHAACTQYEITVKNKDGILENTSVKLQHTDGTIITSLTTDENGKIAIPSSSKAGTYDVYVIENSVEYKIGHVKVNYIDNCQSEMVPANSCPIFTLTVQDQYGIKRPNITVTIKDANGNTIATGTTDADGKVMVPYTIEPGTYKIYEGTTLLGTITTITCEAVFRPSYPVTPPGGEGNTTPPTNPGEPENPGTPPTNPGEPENPGTPPTNPGEPTNPGTPPTNPGEPENPGTPPTNPGEPENPSTPPTNPDEPENPGTPPTNPGEPENPGTPPTNPGGSENLGTSPTNPGEPKNPGTPPTNPGEPTETGTSKTKTALKLPQTNGNFSTATTLFGLTLLAAAALLIVRRKKAIK